MTEILKAFGPPGTGKTTHLLDCVEKELESGISPDEIIYTSFTRSAAYEARDRALARFPDFHRDEFTFFSTIHSICFRELGLTRDNVFSGKKLAEFCNLYSYETSGEGEADFEIELPEAVLRTDVDYFEYFIGLQRNLMITFDEAYDAFTKRLDVPEGFSYDILKLYIRRRNEYKTENSLWDFCDMVERCISEGIVPPGIKVMFTDEFQDLSPLLSKITELWSSGVDRYYVAGDPYQAIYTFMGAKPEIFIGLKSDKSLVLKQSHRCPAKVHDISRVIVDRFSVRYKDDDYIPRSGDGEVSKILPGDIDWDGLSAGGKIFYLHRTRWLLSQAFADLTLSGIPFATVRGRKSPLQTEKAGVVSSLFGLLNLGSITMMDLVTLMDYLPSKTPKEIYLKQGAKAECKRRAHEKPHATVGIRDLPLLGFTSDFMVYLRPESILNPFKFSPDERAYFTKLIRNYGFGVLNAEPKVILSTIHGVKGRECATSIINLNLTKRTYEALLDEPDPEHRLFYVGVTRSSNRVILIEPESYHSYRL